METRRRYWTVVGSSLLLGSRACFAAAMPPMDGYLQDSSTCVGPMVDWDVTTAMCRPVPMAGMPMGMVMVHGQAFAVFISEQGPRGRREVAAPHMLMAEVGHSLGDGHYVNLELMATAERWTFPERGYPELLQVGEKDRHGDAFIDAQHPHNSPVMGLTLSDSVALPGARNHLKLSFAPRGESSDGPIAFMHRPTGSMNPDAPLGHHVGQDVGHISSTVLAAALKLGTTEIQASAFHGREPEPTRNDVVMGPLDSWAGRIVQELQPGLTAMASAALVRHPEPEEPELNFVTRYSASLYHQMVLSSGWTLYNTFIYGSIHNLDHTSLLRSYSHELLLRGHGPHIWTRLEVLQRTPAELAVAASGDPHRQLWVTAATVGYTHVAVRSAGMELGLGTSVTKDFLPTEFRPAYTNGGTSELSSGAMHSPWTAKVFVQLSGAGMWDWQ